MPKVKRDDIVWVEPRLVAEVSFAEWTHDGRLRAPVYKGLREDKAPEEVRREEPLEPEITRGKRVLKLSNLDKPFWPEEGITKGDLIAYYRDVASAIVPHLQDRPFTMKRYPDGWQGKHFFQKDAPSHMPDWIPTFQYRSTSRATREKRTLRYPLVNDELALLWMANMGCIDMNTWYSRVDKPERPDWVLFDLDPSPDVGFPEVVRVALLIKDVLDALDLAGFPKTSGADGFHVLVPIARRYTYEQTREFAEIVAGTLARLHHGLVTTEWAKAKRRGVLVDSNQNGEGKTIASRLLRAPAAGSARVDPAPLGGGHRGARPVQRSRWRPSSTACGAKATSMRTCSRRGSPSARRWPPCASPWRRVRACAGSSRCGRSARTRAARRAASASPRRRREGRRARARRRAPPRRRGA